jgi:hypothetical protein
MSNQPYLWLTMVLAICTGAARAGVCRETGNRCLRGENLSQAGAGKGPGRVAQKREAIV